MALERGRAFCPASGCIFRKTNAKGPSRILSTQAQDVIPRRFALWFSYSLFFALQSSALSFSTLPFCEGTQPGHASPNLAKPCYAKPSRAIPRHAKYKPRRAAFRMTGLVYHNHRGKGKASYARKKS